MDAYHSTMYNREIEKKKPKYLTIGKQIIISTLKQYATIKYYSIFEEFLLNSLRKWSQDIVKYKKKYVKMKDTVY